MSPCTMAVDVLNTIVASLSTSYGNVDENALCCALAVTRIEGQYTIGTRLYSRTIVLARTTTVMVRCA